MKQKQTTNVKNTKLRNIGIIAHVDAGKTTVSERILYYTGQIHRTVEVHEGGAAMDFRPWEQAHGITVSSAATTVMWKDHTLSIIDTPGHIDFNIEVKRALRVLDGAIVVFDAVAGVEPQTETNWRLADQFSVPRVAFINKMDRQGANFERVCDMMQQRFDKVMLPIHLPFGEEFEGLIDIVTGVRHSWLGAEHLTEDASNLPEVIQAREQLVENLAMLDEEIMRSWNQGDELTAEQMHAAIRRVTISQEAVPILCGTALKNMGVELLLDAVVNFLPNPAEVSEDFATDCSVLYAFKAEAQRHQTLTFCRVYQGSVATGDVLWNTVSGQRERVSRIQRVLADECETIEEAYAGEIVALVGLKSTHMGHTLCSKQVDFVLEEITIPEAVTSMALEAKDSAERDKIVACLQLLTREDPTLRLHTDAETGQLILSGMGELHLQIACERLEAMSKCQVRLGKPQVSYRETITEFTTVEYVLSKQSGGPGMYAGLTIEVEPLPRGEGFSFDSTVTGGAIAQDYIPSVEKGIKRRLLNGVLEGHQVVDLKVTLVDGKMHPNDSSARAFEIAAVEAIAQALQQAKSVILEPIMAAQIECHADVLGSVIGDVSRRRGVVVDQNQDSTGMVKIATRVPLANLFGVVGDLRSLTSGRSSFNMEFDHYAIVS